jgi:hypothetical protein
MGTDELTAWQQGLGDRIARLQGVVPSSVTLDHSAISLRIVESVVLVRFGDRSGDEVLAEDDREFTLDVAAYLGETLRRAAPSRWTWTDDGFPEVAPDAGLGLVQVSPIHVIMAALYTANNHEFTEVLDRWAAAAAQRSPADRADAPPPVAADDPRRGTYPPELAAWLDRQERRFPTWMVSFAPDADLDFTAESLTGLESAVRGWTSGWAELSRPLSDNLREGAEWYLGEVVRRGYGGRWSADGGTRRIELAGRDLVPVDALRRALNEPGYLQAEYHRL